MKQNDSFFLKILRWMKKAYENENKNVSIKSFITFIVINFNLFLQLYLKLFIRRNRYQSLFKTVFFSLRRLK